MSSRLTVLADNGNEVMVNLDQVISVSKSPSGLQIHTTHATGISIKINDIKEVDRVWALLSK